MTALAVYNFLQIKHIKTKLLKNYKNVQEIDIIFQRFGLTSEFACFI